jgi:hypothetical protein
LFAFCPAEPIVDLFDRQPEWRSYTTPEQVEFPARALCQPLAADADMGCRMFERFGSRLSDWNLFLGVAALAQLRRQHPVLAQFLASVHRHSYQQVVAPALVLVEHLQAEQENQHHQIDETLGGP